MNSILCKLIVIRDKGINMRGQLAVKDGCGNKIKVEKDDAVCWGTVVVVNEHLVSQNILWNDCLGQIRTCDKTHT